MNQTANQAVIKPAGIQPASLVHGTVKSPAPSMCSFTARLHVTSSSSHFKAPLSFSFACWSLRMGQRAHRSGGAQPNPHTIWHRLRDSICCSLCGTLPPRASDETLKAPLMRAGGPPRALPGVPFPQLTGSPCPGSSWASWTSSPQGHQAVEGSFFFFSSLEQCPLGKENE